MTYYVHIIHPVTLTMYQIQPPRGGLLVVVIDNAPHGFRLLSEKNSLHGLYEGEDNASNPTSPSRHRIDLQPNRVVASSPAEPEHTHALLALAHVRTRNNTNRV